MIRARIVKIDRDFYKTEPQDFRIEIYVLLHIARNCRDVMNS